MLTALTKDSSERLKAIESLLPAGLRDTVRAGPIEGATWCLLVKEQLQQQPSCAKYCLHCRLICAIKGWEVNSIRLKVQTGLALN